jgi:hypothetical protein
MPAARAAFEINAAQSAQGLEQDLSAVLLEMESKLMWVSGTMGPLAVASHQVTSRFSRFEFVPHGRHARLIDPHRSQ